MSDISPSKSPPPQVDGLNLIPNQSFASSTHATHDLPSTSSGSSSKTPSTGTPSPSLERKIEETLALNRENMETLASAISSPSASPDKLIQN